MGAHQSNKGLWWKPNVFYLNPLAKPMPNVGEHVKSKLILNKPVRAWRKIKLKTLNTMMYCSWQVQWHTFPAASSNPGMLAFHLVIWKPSSPQVLENLIGKKSEDQLNNYAMKCKSFHSSYRMFLIRKAKGTTLGPILAPRSVQIFQSSHWDHVLSDLILDRR